MLSKIKEPEATRSIRVLRQPRRILVICEDTKSALLYLKSFPLDKDRVLIEYAGTGKNTASLMREAIRRKELADAARAPFESIWVVFDKDDFPPDQFNQAFDMAGTHRTINVIWSNECFELWYLLHYGFHHTAIGRDDIYRKLSENDRLGIKYTKSDDGI